MSKTLESPEEQFAKTVADALKHYNYPQWLGQHSPLATPYFLGNLLREVDQPETAEGRGAGLRLAIGRAADALWPGTPPQSRKVLLNLVEEERAVALYGPRYLFLLLDLRYLRRYFPPHSAPNTVGAMYDLLNVSSTRFFVHLQRARAELAEALLRVTRPSLRLECPLPPVLIGRDDLLGQCMADLQNGRSVSLSGQAGIGKTSFGARLANDWSSGPVFWHTFRPGLNDDLAGVVFSLAHFLQQQGCSNLWLQLMANTSILEHQEQLTGFLREDLQCAARKPVLLCFDELDLLQTAATQPRHGVHKQILELLDSLQDLTPLLLIGQRALVDTDVLYELQPLTRQDTEAMVRAAGVSLPESITRIQRITGGNPRFLELYIALRKSDPAGEEPDLGKSPSLHPLFSRLWKRLDNDEKRLLTTLSIFRSMAPVDAWQGRAGFGRLQERNLLKFDAHGGVALLPLFRDIIFGELPPLQQRQLHEEGAVLRAQRGQYTEAAHHLWQAGLYEKAIDLWYAKQKVEIDQGKAGAAYALFSDKEPSGLSEAAGKKLIVIRGRLRLLHGDAAHVLEEMDSYSWHLDEKITAEALEQWGEAYYITGLVDDTLSSFESAINVLRELSTQTALLHRRRGQIFAEFANLDLAERESKLAYYEAVWLKAVIESVQGRFVEAQECFLEARRLATAVGDAGRIARSTQFLAMAAGNHGDYEQARQYAREAMAYYEETGDRLNLENMRAEVAGFYLNEDRFAEAIEPLLSSLQFFEHIKHDLRIAHTSSNLAEAYFETGQLEAAETYALRAMQSEIQRVQPYACYTLGQVRYAQNRFADAQHVFQTGMSVANQTEDRFITAYLYRAYGKILCCEGRLDEGIRALQNACTLFENLEMPAEAENTTQILESYAEAEEKA